MRSFKEWWEAERLGRPEKDTSQDMCPTNGDSVIMMLVMLCGYVHSISFGDTDSRCSTCIIHGPPKNNGIRLCYTIST